jgi:hypothetical protein
MKRSINIIIPAWPFIEDVMLIEGVVAVDCSRNGLYVVAVEGMA